MKLAHFVIGLFATTVHAYVRPARGSSLDCSRSADPIKQIHAHVKYPIDFCQTYLASGRNYSPLPAQAVSIVVPACECILQEAGMTIPLAGSGKPLQIVPALGSVACNSSLARIIKINFTYPKAFCRYMTHLSNSITIFRAELNCAADHERVRLHFAGKLDYTDIRAAESNHNEESISISSPSILVEQATIKPEQNLDSQDSIIHFVILWCKQDDFIKFSLKSSKAIIFKLGASHKGLFDIDPALLCI
ncbi:hypothetical protein K461DRAFT_297117 [Myriangium duriaei CBS 260.36]|uniref:Uncharacterized protein n=1 Tax=Myriangium duriaei CBS 260.36 TaxID=1168546 RepID=A0A9P4MD95_9PEZI|nr:hypothetical protein K461DRAFT_297117 [Myriangium duriaei CBS 260.36]